MFVFVRMIFTSSKYPIVIPSFLRAVPSYDMGLPNAFVVSSLKSPASHAININCVMWINAVATAYVCIVSPYVGSRSKLVIGDG